jgi:hypothetical protein
MFCASKIMKSVIFDTQNMIDPNIRFEMGRFRGRAH